MRLANKAADYLKRKEQPSDKQRALDDAIWPIVDKYRSVGLEIRRPYEQQWMLNLAFLCGRQYVFYNTSLQIIQDIVHPRNRHQKRYVDNKLMPRWKRQISDFIRNNPEMSVVPNSEDEEDIQAAKAGDKVLKYVWQSKRMRRNWRLLGGWIYSCGNGFLGDRWDRKSGPITTDKQGNIVYGGDVAVECWSPFEVLVPAVPNGPIDIHQMPWLIKMKFRDLSWFRNTFGPQFTVESETNTYSSLDLGAMLLGHASNTHTETEGAWMVNLYIQPCEDYPKGLFVGAANGTVFVTDDYPLNEYPLEHFKDIDSPGVFWGKATLEDAIPLQIGWNATVNDMHTYNKYMAKGRMMAPKRSKLEILPQADESEIIKYKPVVGYKPEFINPRGGSTSHQQALETLHLSLQDLFHQHEVTRGTNKSDIRSGEMAAFLREQDAYGGVPTHAAAEEALEQLFSRVLQRVVKGYTAQRTIKVVGAGKEMEVLALKGADLRNNTDVSVKRQSMLPDSRVAREARIKERFKEGVYGHPQDPRVIKAVGRMLEDAVIEDIYSSHALDTGVAVSENSFMAQNGIGVPVNNYDNHQIHVEEHNNFRKQPRYQKLKLTNPQAFAQLEAAFGEHVGVHQQFIQEQMEAALRRQAILGGQSERRNA